jgi:hypothetical protein
MTSKNTVERLAKAIFGKNEVQNRIALSAVKMIIGDMATLYAEFRKTEGLGGLFFNPANPECSHYMTLKDIHTDVILAEEIMDDFLKDFLNKLINVINKEAESEQPIIVMVDDESMSVHVLDLNSAEERINEVVDAVSRD